jgi:hypothetical protein
MGDGLKRAFAAAARSRLALSERELDFLRRLRDGERLRLADYEEDRVRQRLRKAGLAQVLQAPRRWVITDAGRAALSTNTSDRG